MEQRVAEIQVEDKPIRLAAIGISKAFGATQALSQVSFDVVPGEIHALLGENGAGKSTLIKIMAGDYFADTGQIRYEDRPVDLKSPADSRQLGIRVIYQEFNLVPSLTVAENICVGNYPSGSVVGTVSWSGMKRRAQEVLDRLGEVIPVDARVRQLSVAQQQVVEIAKALLDEPTVLIMDEPTSALNDQETEHLFDLLRRLRSRGVSIIYISHRIEELFALADRVTVLRDGRTVDTVPIASATRGQLVRMMVGRELKEMYPKRQIPVGDTILRVKNLHAGPKVRNVSFRVHKGEIVAVFGLLGAGQSELARALFGEVPIVDGEVELHGRPVKLGSTTEARRAGFGLIPDDRKGAGLIGALSVKANGSIAALPRFSRAGIVDGTAETQVVKRWIERLDVRCAGLSQQIKYLSGGNQQKVVIGRWLANECKMLILDQPTRGVDVGAKVEIYRLLEDLAEQGVGILMISLEMPEVLGIADTILVMHEGRIAGEYSRKNADQAELMRCAVGVCEEAFV
ncbi:MAG TPA: sugar ABC transporter ATP-binding protein [Chloroflexota bacterium]